MKENITINELENFKKELTKNIDINQLNKKNFSNEFLNTLILNVFKINDLKLIDNEYNIYIDLNKNIILFNQLNNLSFNKIENFFKKYYKDILNFYIDRNKKRIDFYCFDRKLNFKINENLKLSLFIKQFINYVLNEINIRINSIKEREQRILKYKEINKKGDIILNLINDFAIQKNYINLSKYYNLELLICLTDKENNCNLNLRIDLNNNNIDKYTQRLSYYYYDKIDIEIKNLKNTQNLYNEIINLLSNNDYIFN